MEDLKNQKKVFIGGLLVVVGVLYILRNIGIIPNEISTIIFTWPVFLILLGIFFYITNKSTILSIVFVSMGVFFLIPHMFHIPCEFKQIFWPVLIIIAGVVMILRKPSDNSCKREKFNKFRNTETNADKIDEIAIFGGCEKYITTNNFSGGKITCIFGGTALDFSNAVLADGIITIEIANIFGGSKLIIPSDWNVKIEVVSIFGGFNDDRRNISPVNINPNKILIIKGACVFGGGQISN